MKNLTVGEVMDTAPPTIRAGQLLDEVVATLIKHHVSGLPVLNEKLEVVGFVSEHDCIHSLKVSSYHSDAMVPVEDVMNHEVYAVSANMLLIDLVDTMETDRPKVFPVTEDKKLVGLITRPQVLLVLAESSIGCGFTYKVAH